MFIGCSFGGDQASLGEFAQLVTALLVTLITSLLEETLRFGRITDCLG